MDASIKYISGYKYQLSETYTIQTGITPEEDYSGRFITFSKSGVLTIKEGYAWDGPSGPTFDTKNFMRGSLVHDALYQAIRLGVLSRSQRPYVDKLLRKICLEDGMSSIRSWWVFKGVSWFADDAAFPSAEHQIECAP
jgi:hypothetical protein